MDLGYLHPRPGLRMFFFVIFITCIIVFVPVSVLMVVEGGWLMIIPTALGSGVGIVSSIIFYQSIKV